ncbi:2Fe-2S iron-sulfur cluster binding domain-containing protein [Croceicoccus sp. YJ47]|nr:2Fe-2S iron-sulfur cluster-binding protein [Croceicoccus sp. YJ47]QQN73319.1 2Fe-2S iron-sulfur cluster binding domain-containing protein [Croceicoccus sp. YJ47]
MRLTAKNREPSNVKTKLIINEQDRELDADPRVTLLDALRNHLGLPGAKKGCDHGQCGACTVIVNGRRVNSCLTLACMHDGDAVTTIEGIGMADDLDSLQQAFVRHDGYQCGYCTPGQICSARAMLDEAEAGWPSFVSEEMDGVIDLSQLSDEEISERMSGNICRCSAYSNIVDAIREIAHEKQGASA